MSTDTKVAPVAPTPKTAKTAKASKASKASKAKVAPVQPPVPKVAKADAKAEAKAKRSAEREREERMRDEATLAGVPALGPALRALHARLGAEASEFALLRAAKRTGKAVQSAERTVSLVADLA